MSKKTVADVFAEYKPESYSLHYLAFKQQWITRQIVTEQQFQAAEQKKLALSMFNYLTKFIDNYRYEDPEEKFNFFRIWKDPRQKDQIMELTVQGFGKILGAMKFIADEHLTVGEAVALDSHLIPLLDHVSLIKKFDKFSLDQYLRWAQGKGKQYLRKAQPFLRHLKLEQIDALPSHIFNNLSGSRIRSLQDPELISQITTSEQCRVLTTLDSFDEMLSTSAVLELKLTPDEAKKVNKLSRYIINKQLSIDDAKVVDSKVVTNIHKMYCCRDIDFQSFSKFLKQASEVEINNAYTLQAFIPRYFSPQEAAALELTDKQRQLINDNIYNIHFHDLSFEDTIRTCEQVLESKQEELFPYVAALVKDVPEDEKIKVAKIIYSLRQNLDTPFFLPLIKLGVDITGISKLASHELEILQEFYFNRDFNNYFHHYTVEVHALLSDLLPPVLASLTMEYMGFTARKPQSSTQASPALTENGVTLFDEKQQDRRLNAAQLYNQACSAFAAKGYSDAAALFVQALQLFREVADTQQKIGDCLYNLAACHGGLGEYHKVLEYLLKLLQLKQAYSYSYIPAATAINRRIDLVFKKMTKEQLYEYALSKYNKEEYEEAMCVIEEAIYKVPVEFEKRLGGKGDSDAYRLPFSLSLSAPPFPGPDPDINEKSRKLRTSCYRALADRYKACHAITESLVLTEPLARAQAVEDLDAKERHSGKETTQPSPLVSTEVIEDITDIRGLLSPVSPRSSEQIAVEAMIAMRLRVLNSSNQAQSLALRPVSSSQDREASLLAPLLKAPWS